MTRSFMSWISMLMCVALVSPAQSAPADTSRIAHANPARQTEPGAMTISINDSPINYSSNTTGNDMYFYFQQEIYLLDSDQGVEYDCPDANLTLYLSQSIPRNYSLDNYGKVLENGILLINNSFASYCPEISDFTLLGVKDFNQNFSNAETRTRYISLFSNLDYQYAVVVLNHFLGSNAENRSITFEATATDFRNIIAPFSTPPEGLEALVPSPYSTGDSTESIINGTLYKLRKRQSVFGGIAKVLTASLKAAPKVAKPIAELPTFVEALLPAVLQAGQFAGPALDAIRAELSGEPQAKGQFNSPALQQTQVDIPGISTTEGHEGYTYELFQFYYEGEVWPEIWRRRVDPKSKPSPAPQPTPPNSQPPTPSRSIASSSVSSKPTTVPVCQWRRKDQPLKKPKKGLFNYLDWFKIDLEQALLSGNLEIPFQSLIDGDAEDVPETVASNLDTAAESLGPVELNSAISPQASGSPSVNHRRNNQELKTNLPLLPHQLQDISPGASMNENAVEVDERQNSYNDGSYGFAINELVLDLQIGNTTPSVIPPGVNFTNYAFYSSGSFYFRAMKPLITKKFKKILFTVPIGGCGTNPQPSQFSIDAFFMVYLSGAVSTGSNGSATIDFSYQWDPIEFTIGLGDVTDSSGQMNTTLGDVDLGSVAESLSKGFKFNYARLSTDFPDLSLSVGLAPALQLDLTLLSASYSRGVTIGPVFDIAANLSASVGNEKTSASASSAGALQTSPSNYTFSNRVTADLSINKPVSGMRFGLAMTTYVYGSITGSWASYIFTLPKYKQEIKWLWGPKDVLNTVKNAIGM